MGMKWKSIVQVNYKTQRCQELARDLAKSSVGRVEERKSKRLERIRRQ